MNDYDQAIEFLYGRIDYERTSRMPYGRRSLKLQRMRHLLQKLGDPQNAFQVLHVAGTKGKGSTCLMLEAMLRAAGDAVGCFTSPHLHRLEERFRVDGLICQPGRIVEHTKRLQTVVADMDHDSASGGPPTYFELTTAIALMEFARAKVKYAVLEVGLGGRLDSTNVCQPLVTGITSISYDHMHQLGNTLTAIATEKAGIIKPSVPVVNGATQPEARTVISDIARQRDAPLQQLGVDFNVRYSPAERSRNGWQWPRIDYQSTRRPDWQRALSGMELSTLGQHQGRNAAVAIGMLENVFAAPADLRSVRKGLASIRLPGRIQLLRHDPIVIVDTAHNAASTEALVQTLRNEFDNPTATTLVFAISQDKDAGAMLHDLVHYFDRIICTRYTSNPRSMSPDELLRHARRIATAEGSIVELVTAADATQAWQLANENTRPTDLICISGSFFSHRR